MRLKVWWVYVLRCGDGSFYTGISTDPDRRLDQHRTGHGARYTRGRQPIDPWWHAGPFDKSQALREERRVKSLSHHQKEALRADGRQQ